MSDRKRFNPPMFVLWSFMEDLSKRRKEVGKVKANSEFIEKLKSGSSFGEEETETLIEILQASIDPAEETTKKDLKE